MPEGLGALVRRERMRRGWTQAELASQLGEGVDRAYISQIETGGRKWPQELIGRLSDVLDISEVNMAVEAGLISARYATIRPSMMLNRNKQPDPNDPRTQLVELAEALDQVKLETALRLLRALHESRAGWT